MNKTKVTVTRKGLSTKVTHRTQESVQRKGRTRVYKGPKTTTTTYVKGRK